MVINLFLAVVVAEEIEQMVVDEEIDLKIVDVVALLEGVEEEEFCDN